MKKILTIEQFGAVADGVFDNTDAFIKAFDAIRELDCDVDLYLQPHGKYYFADNGFEIEFSALRIRFINNLTIIGDKTVILCDGARPYMHIFRCKNLVIKGLTFDMKRRAHFIGNFVSVDKENLTAVVKADRDFDMPDSYETLDQGCYFGLLNTGEELSRIYFFIEGYDWVDKEERLINIRFNKEDTLGTHYNVRNLLFEGRSLILPLPFVGHRGHRSFTIDGNHNLSFIDCDLINYPHFGLALWYNSGTVLFKNFNVVAPFDEPVDFVGWRDTFHCKTNTAKIIWDSCTAKGGNDDIINLSVNMLYIEKINSPTDIVCCWRETHGQYCPDYFDMTGCPVEIWNVDTGKIVAKTKIKEVVDYKTNHYILEDPIDTSAYGENVRLCVENHIALGSEIINCNFKGTLRLKSHHTVKNSTLWLLRMWIDHEIWLEGPIPKNVLFENVDFKLPSPTEKVFLISSRNEVFEMKNDETYHLENIVFKNCRGIEKENFWYDSNFIEGSVNEIKIID